MTTLSGAPDLATLLDTDGPLDGSCPVEVRHPSMVHHWNELTFFHWSYDPEVVQRLLPAGLTVETIEGRAWVGLVPFSMVVRPPRGGPLPWVSRFPETNVRTYVTAPDGTRGVWFLSLEAARLGAVVVARTTYRLPYFWAAMDVTRAGPVLTYTSRRRWPGPRGASTRVCVRVGEPFAPHELGPLDHRLTARWRLYSDRRTGLRGALAAHDPWPLHRAELLHLDDQLVRAAGLPEPVGEPLVHWSPGVEVRIGLPYRVPGA